MFDLLLNVELEAVVLSEKKKYTFLKRRSGTLLFMKETAVFLLRVHRLLGYNLYLNKSVSCFHANYMDYVQINSISLKKYLQG